MVICPGGAGELQIQLLEYELSMPMKKGQEHWGKGTISPNVCV